MDEYHFRSPIRGAPIYHFRELTSTMSVARDLVSSGAESGSVILADYQSEGRGRIPGRRWVSPPGESLMFTVAMEVSNPQAMPLRAGLSVALALETACGLQPRIKWPNDVMVRDRKICGILCEYAQPWLYVGVGLNLTQQEFPDDLASPATSVTLELGLQPDQMPERDELLGDIVRGLGELPGDYPGEWVGMVNDRLWRKGSRVSVTVPDGSRVRGTLVGIDGDGALIIDCAGEETSLIAGEIDPPGNNRDIP